MMQWVTGSLFSAAEPEARWSRTGFSVPTATRRASSVIDRDDNHVYQPGLLFVPFGLAEPSEIVRPRHAQFRKGIDFRLAEVDSVDVALNTVHLLDGSEVPYDVLVVATGASLQPEETEGLTGPEWGQSIHTFYSLEGASLLQART